MGWVCNKCGKDNGGVQGVRKDCFETKKCKDAGQFACSWASPPEPEWTYLPGQLSTPGNMPKATEDLTELIKQLAASVHSAVAGTLVGGMLAKKGKRIEGLNDPNARLDIQNSPGKGKYNLQYQIGNYSVACVLYTDEDSEGKVLGELHASLRAHQNSRSPSYG